MKGFQVSLLSLMLGLTVGLAHAKNTTGASGFSDPDDTIIVTPDRPEFTVKLSIDPRSGYAWFLKDYNSKIVRVLNSHYIEPKRKNRRAPGMSIWKFKVFPGAFKVQHLTNIEFVHAQPWNLKTNDKHITFNIITSGCGTRPNADSKHLSWVC